MADITDDRADAFRAHMLRAVRIADEATLELVESEGVHWRDAEGIEWFDIRWLLDPREHAPELIDQHALTVEYGLERRLLARHPDPQRPHFVRVARRPRTT